MSLSETGEAVHNKCGIGKQGQLDYEPIATADGADHMYINLLKGGSVL